MLLRHSFSTMQNSPAFTTKGPRLQLSRWHSFLDVCEHWRPYLPLRRLVLTYHGIMEGWVLRLPGACVFKNTGLANRQEDAPKAPTSILANAAVIAKLWKLCANTLHVSLVILLDLNVLGKCEIMWQMSRPQREWHADQAMLLRSPAESILYNTVGFRNFIVFFRPRPWHIEIRHRSNKHPQLICSGLGFSN